MNFSPILQNALFSLSWQEAIGTNSFFMWYFYGLGGLGGWFLFLLLAVGAVIWLMYDSQTRRLPATGWKLGVVVLTLLILPTILYRFTVTPVDYEVYHILQLDPEVCPGDLLVTTGFADCDQLLRSLPPLTPYGEVIFYLGLLGGILAPILAVGYAITFQGMKGCPQGHVYEKALEKSPGRCPQCAAAADAGRRFPPGPQVVDPPLKPRVRSEPPAPRKPAKRTVQSAWLVDQENNRRYDLCVDATLIGRLAENDIMLADPAVSKRHAQIREAHGHFTISDLGSASGTYVNGKKLHAPLVLQSSDEITLGDTQLKFISS